MCSHSTMFWQGDWPNCIPENKSIQSYIYTRFNRHVVIFENILNNFVIFFQRKVKFLSSHDEFFLGTNIFAKLMLKRLIGPLVCSLPTQYTFNTTDLSWKYMPTYLIVEDACTRSLVANNFILVDIKFSYTSTVWACEIEYSPIKVALLQPQIQIKRRLEIWHH